MIRRTFLVDLISLTALPAFADEATHLDYVPGHIAERLAAGETLLVSYTTDWCTTCAAQNAKSVRLSGKTQPTAKTSPSSA
ncbi:MAG: hypothetical protein QNK92_10610 [Amylibacter sp.]